MAKLIRGNVQGCFSLIGHEPLCALLIASLLFSLQGYHKRLSRREVGTPFLLYSGGQKKSEALWWHQAAFLEGQPHFHLDGLLLWAEGREKLCWVGSRAGAAVEPAFFLVGSAGKGLLAGSPLGVVRLLYVCLYFFVYFLIFVQVFGCCHETRARCSQPAANPAASHLAAVKPPWHCCSEGWACSLLATGVSDICAAAKRDKLLDWLKTTLKKSFLASWPDWLCGNDWQCWYKGGSEYTQLAKDTATPYSYAAVLLWLFLPLTQCIYHQPLSSWSCPATAAAWASIRFACVGAGWEEGDAETAVLHGHTTTAVFSLHLYPLLFLSLSFLSMHQLR